MLVRPGGKGVRSERVASRYFLKFPAGFSDGSEESERKRGVNAFGLRN